MQVTPLTSMCVSEHDITADYWFSSACVITLLFGTQVCAVIIIDWRSSVHRDQLIGWRSSVHRHQ